jgi:hypothetical protein
MKKLVLALACAIASFGSHAQAPTLEVSRVISTIEDYTEHLSGEKASEIASALHPTFYATGFDRTGKQQPPMNPEAFLQWVEAQAGSYRANVRIQEVIVEGQHAQVKLTSGPKTAPRTEQLTLQKDGDGWKIVTYFYRYGCGAPK